MSTEANGSDQEPLNIANEFLGLGGANKDALCIAEAIYALAREVRAMRPALDYLAKNGADGVGSVSDRLEEIRDQLRVG